MSDNLSNKSDKGTLEYNLVWMERTFKTRPITESLLSPERDAGLLTTHDYEAAVNFLPNAHRHYNTIGTGLGGLIGFGLRAPHWAPTRTVPWVAFGALAGRAAGSALAVIAHYKFIQSIENPASFSKAMENVQIKLGQPLPTSDRTNTTDNNQEYDFPPPPITHSSKLESNEPPANHVPGSSWDRVRATSARSARNSSWDVIRQSHEKSQIQNQPPRNQPGHTESLRDDRGKEQAKFDTLLEKERNMK